MSNRRKIMIIVLSIVVGIILGFGLYGIKDNFFQENSNDNGNHVDGNKVQDIEDNAEGVSNENSRNDEVILSDSEKQNLLEKLEKKLNTFYLVTTHLDKGFNNKLQLYKNDFSIEDLDDKLLLGVALFFSSRKEIDETNMFNYGIVKITDGDYEGFYYSNELDQYFMCPSVLNIDEAEKNVRQITFGKTIKNQNTFSDDFWVWDYFYSSKYNTYYFSPCGGGDDWDEASYNYDLKVYPEVVYLYRAWMGPDKWGICAVEDCPNDFTLNEENYKKFSRYKIIFKKYNGEYEFYQIEEIKD